MAPGDDRDGQDPDLPDLDASDPSLLEHGSPSSTPEFTDQLEEAIEHLEGVDHLETIDPIESFRWQPPFGDDPPPSHAVTPPPAGSDDPVVDELAPYDAMETLVDARHKLTKVPHWMVIGAGLVFFLGLVLGLGFVFRSGSDDADDEAAAATSETTVDDTAAPSTMTPAAAVDAPEPSIVFAVDDPLNYVTVIEASLLVDPNDEVYVLATLAAPWDDGPPGPDDAWNLIVRVGLDLGPRVHTVQWTLHDGTTRGESFIEGDARAALDAEIWVTDPGGQLAFRLPGISPTGGLSFTEIGGVTDPGGHPTFYLPDISPAGELSGGPILVLGQYWPDEDSEIQRIEASLPIAGIGPIGVLPLPGWQRVQTDLGPITLIIPDTSDQ